MLDQIQKGLQHYYTTVLSQPNNQVEGLTALSNGWESDVYGFDLEQRTPNTRWRTPLVLRIYPGDDAYAKSAREFTGMRHLYDLGYPVPQVFHLERERSPFGKPFVIMERIEGQLLWPILENASPVEQAALLNLFTGLFFQLHQLDWRPFAADGPTLDADNPYRFINETFTRFHQAFDQFPLSGFEPLWAWLAARRDWVPCWRPTPVHLDYHPNNVLLRADGSAAVIDWTQLEISDPRFDLAWTLVLAYSHASEQVYTAILREYERLAGEPMADLAFFEVVACLKRLGSVVISLTYGPEKLGMRPEAVVAMRQQFPALRNVYTLLRARTGIQLAEVERCLSA